MFRSIALLLLADLFSTAYALPEINTWTTEQGIKVLYVEAPELPMVDLALTFDAGSARDGNLPGLSTLTHVLLNKGTGSLDADEVATKFEDLGAQFSTSVDLDRSSVTLRSLSDEALFTSALDVFIQVVSKPSFPERDFARERRRMLISLEEQEQKPGKIAGDAFYTALYQQHPYAKNSDGSKDSLNKIALADVHKFHQQYITTNNAVLAIVGNVDQAKAKAIADKMDQALPAGKVFKEISSAPATGAQTKNIDFPSQQAHVRIGQIGIERGHPDYFPLYVGNHILGGGGFTSRLVDEVRSKRGLSYSVYSYFFPYQQAGPFMLGLQTRTDQVEEAIQVCNQVLNEYIANGPTEEELSLSKQNIVNGFPLRIDSNRDILGYLSMIGYYNLPITYLNDFRQNIEAVTLKQIKAAFKKHLNLEAFVTVIVGSGQESGT